MNKKRIILSARMVALLGVMAATLEVGKFALSFIPNVEVVTILCALYGYTFGPISLISVLTFITIETFINGFNTWVLSYIIHFGSICIAFCIAKKLNIKKPIIITLIAAILTTCFGVTSSLIDTGLFTGHFDRFFYRFSIIYVRGIWFYVTEIVCNIILFYFFFGKLSELLEKLKKKFFSI